MSKSLQGNGLVTIYTSPNEHIKACNNNRRIFIGLLSSRSECDKTSDPDGKRRIYLLLREFTSTKIKGLKFQALRSSPPGCNDHSISNLATPRRLQYVLRASVQNPTSIHEVCKMICRSKLTKDRLGIKITILLSNTCSDTSQSSFCPRPLSFSVS